MCGVYSARGKASLRRTIASFQKEEPALAGRLFVFLQTDQPVKAPQ
jgi:hypothetical protein